MMKKELVGLLLGAMACTAQAAYTITIAPDGADVVATGSGTLDTTGIAFNIQNNFCGAAGGLIGSNLVCVGGGNTGMASPNALSPAFNGLSSGAFTPATSSSGPSIIIQGMGLNLPAAYVSGAALSNQSRFAAATLASLGLTAGFTRNLSLPSGDTITVRVLAVAPAPAVTATSIPTLSEYGLMALASLMAMFGFRHLRRRQS